MSRTSRIVVVTLGLIVAGALFGGIAGASALTISVLITEGFSGTSDSLLIGFAAIFGAIIGAIIGAVVAPLGGWLLLRYVPLGAAIVWSTVATGVGGVGGWVLAGALRSRFGGPLPLLGDEVGYALLGAFIGFVACALWLRRRALQRRLLGSQSHAAAV
jgi:hypothetical protein